MGYYEKTFEWIDFPEGRVRYEGGGANREEPKEAFAVELYGQIYYGEIKEQFFPNGNDYNLEIVSFGWLENGWYGTLPVSGHCAAFTFKELEIIQMLIRQAVQVWHSFEKEERPYFLGESVKSHFMGDVLFRGGWALIKNEGVTS